MRRSGLSTPNPNARVHGTTQKVVADAFAAERSELQPLPAMPFDALLKLERRVSHDGLVSIAGNYYSVPDRTRRIWNFPGGSVRHGETPEVAARRELAEEIGLAEHSRWSPRATPGASGRGDATRSAARVTARQPRDHRRTASIAE